MAKLQETAFRWALPLLLAFAMPAATSTTGDLSKYRGFQLGTDLATVAKQAGANPSQAMVLHRRPVLMQQLEWRPQPLGAPSQTESAKNVVLSFYDDQLFRIAVDYDRYTTEGMTVDDMVEAISSTYGLAAKPTPQAKVAPRSYGDQEEILAQWQDSQFRFDLVRSSYESSFKLVGVLKKLEGPAQVAMIEAARLDDKEAPQREIDRLAKEKDAERVRLEEARLVNKPKFQP
jgi:hypothetical protein